MLSLLIESSQIAFLVKGLMSFVAVRLPAPPLLKNDVVMYTWAPHTAMMMNILRKLIHACDCVVDWVTTSKSLHSCHFSLQLLTIKVWFLNFSLTDDVHWDLIKFEGEAVDFIDHSFNCVARCLLFSNGILILNQEVYFFRLAIRLLPAHLNLLLILCSELLGCFSRAIKF